MEKSLYPLQFLVMFLLQTWLTIDLQYKHHINTFNYVYYYDYESKQTTQAETQES